MYGDGNSTKLVSDVMNSTSQIMEGMKESTGIDLSSLLAGFVGGKAAAGVEAPKE
jgi:flotillin